MTHIAIIIGSTRNQRIGHKIAQWIGEIGAGIVPGSVDLVDLRDWPLPMDDEPGIPAMGQYSQPHTLAWSRKVARYGAFVFVTPQYNWGYPAPLKNALDHLYREWTGKPAMIVTYGGHGGGKCGAQLRQVLEGLKMRSVETAPGLSLPRERIEANDGQIVPAAQFADAAGDVVRAWKELAELVTSPRA